MSLEKPKARLSHALNFKGLKLVAQPKLVHRGNVSKKMLPTPSRCSLGTVTGGSPKPRIEVLVRKQALLRATLDWMLAQHRSKAALLMKCLMFQTQLQLELIQDSCLIRRLLRHRMLVWYPQRDQADAYQ